MKQVKALIFDWGGTLMRDFPGYGGPMVKWPKVEAITGVAGLMTAVQNNHLCCVASNAGDSDAGLMSAALGRVDLKKYFHYFFTSKELGYKKPDPGFFTEISTRLGVLASDCLAIGNDYLKDIVPAKDCGMKTALYMEKLVSGQFPKADIILLSMAELLNYL